jgi:hypothetical protein
VRAVEVRPGLLSDELLEELNALAKLVDDLEVLIDHGVEERVTEKTRRVEPSFDEALLDEPPSGEVALMHGHDRVVSDEDRHLVVVDDARARRLEGINDDEVVRLVLIDLGALMTVLRIFDGERVKLQLFGDECELRALRVGDVEPAGMLSAELGELLCGPIDDRVVLFDEEAGRHVRSMRGRSGGEAANDVHELLRVKWLGQESLGVAAIGLVFWIGDAGEDHEWDVAERHVELARERRAVHPRHLHIEHDDRRRILLDRAQRLGSVVRFDHAEATFGQELALDRERRDVVVDD